MTSIGFKMRVGLPQGELDRDTLELMGGKWATTGLVQEASGATITVSFYGYVVWVLGRTLLYYIEINFPVNYIVLPTDLKYINSSVGPS